MCYSSSPLCPGANLHYLSADSSVNYDSATSNHKINLEILPADKKYGSAAQEHSLIRYHHFYAFTVSSSIMDIVRTILMFLAKPRKTQKEMGEITPCFKSQWDV